MHSHAEHGNEETFLKILFCPLPNFLVMNERPSQLQTRPDDVISLSEILAIILNGKWWIIGSTLLFALGSLFYLWIATPIYSANALVQVESQKSPLGDLVEMSEAFTLVAGKDGQYQLIFDDQPVLNGRVGEPGSSGATGTPRGIELFVTELAARPGTEFTLTKEHFITAIDRLGQRMTVSEKGKKTGVFALGITKPEHAENRKTLEAIIKRYLRQNVERVSAEAQNSLQFLEEKLPEVKAELELKIVKASAVGNVRILDHSLSTIEPVKPKKALIAVLATLLGDILGMGMVFVRDMLNQGVKTPEEVETKTMAITSTPTNPNKGSWPNGIVNCWLSEQLLYKAQRRERIALAM